MLRYTGHPLVDVGAATIAAFAGKWDVESVTEADVDPIIEFMKANYVVNPLKSFLNVAFQNSGFTNPAFERMPEKRIDYAERVLRTARAGTASQEERCVFTGEPATSVAFSDTLPPGRAFRQHVPMLTGEGVINFHPWGDAGLPISGQALLCIQALPLGCAWCGGRLLAVHSDSPDLMRQFAGTFLTANRQGLLLAVQTDGAKLPRTPASAKTLLIEILLSAEERRRDEAGARQPSSVTAYHFTNYGQSNPLDTRNPPLAIYHLPAQTTGFLRAVTGPDYRADWDGVVQRAWQLARRPEAGGRTSESGEDDRPRRNYLYEDLFRLPDEAGTFVRRYLLRVPARTRWADDPRREYSLRREAGLVSWRLTDLFARRVIGMDKERVDLIRDLGDRLAEYIDAEEDWHFLTSFFDHRYDRVRTALIKANLLNIKRGRQPLVTLKPYLEVFEEGEELARADWRLARDLVYIRLVEQLYQRGRLRPEAVPEVPAELGESAS